MSARKAAKQLTQRDADDAKSRIAELEKQNKLLEERLNAVQQSRWTIPASKKARSVKKSFIRVIIPDTHGCLVDPAAIAAVLDDIEALQPREIVWLGDHLDCGGFLAQHWTIGYVAETEYTFEQDVDAANDLLDKVQSAAPNAQHHYIAGNHENRLERFCLTQALRKKEDAQFLLRMFGAESQLHLDKRGIPYYRQGQFYMGLSIPATIQLGHCFFSHGHTAAKHAASKMLERYGQNVVFGHIHASQEASTKTVSHGVIKAWCPGALCRLQPLWKHTAPTSWNHGYGVQIVQDDGRFMHCNVPIIDGQSYLIPLTQN